MVHLLQGLIVESIRLGLPNQFQLTSNDAPELFDASTLRVHPNSLQVLLSNLAIRSVTPLMSALEIPTSVWHDGILGERRGLI